jgi:hypothetical protein
MAFDYYIKFDIGYDMEFQNADIEVWNYDIGDLRYRDPISKFMFYDIGKLRYR